MFPILHVRECNAAAAALGLGDLNSAAGESDDIVGGWPEGCFWDGEHPSSLWLATAPENAWQGGSTSPCREPICTSVGGNIISGDWLLTDHAYKELGTDTYSTGSHCADGFESISDREECMGAANGANWAFATPPKLSSQISLYRLIQHIFYLSD
jgi:hypothetical protein